MPPGQRSQYGGNPYWIDQRKVYTPTGSPPPLKRVASPLERANAYDNYNTGPASPDLIYGSRAYANARGSQAGLNIPNSTYATQGQGGYGPAATTALNNGGSSGGYGGGGGAASSIPVDPLSGYIPETVDLSKNPIPGMYDTLLDYISKNAAARPEIFAATGETFKKNQEAANQQMYDAYLGSRKGTDESAVALGVDPAIVSQARDLAMRKSQENSDQSLASNLAWLTKMGLLSQQQAQGYGNMYAGQKASESAKWADLEANRVSQLNLAKLQALVDAQAASSGGGGGGGRGGGGGGSSKSGYTDAASEEGTLYTGGMDVALYDELARTDKAAAAEYMNMFNLTSSSAGVKAAQTRLNDLTKAASYKGTTVTPKLKTGFAGILNPLAKAKAAARNVPVIVKTANAASAKKQAPVTKKVLEAMIATSGNWGNPKVVKKTSSKSSQKVKLK